MYILRLPRLVWTAAISALFLSGATTPSPVIAAAAGIAPIPVQVAQAPDARRDLVQRVQQSLIRLGFDPGPPDGVVGGRTTRSVQQFQRQQGLTADGNVSEALYRALVSSVEKASKTAGPDTGNTAPAQPSAGIPTTSPAVTIAPSPTTAQPAVVIKFTDSRWAIVDSNGARASLTLLGDGKVGGVETPDFWRWQLQDGGLRIMYDNKVGGRVTRRGRIVSENEIRGDADSSRGVKWTWTATRLQ